MKPWEEDWGTEAAPKKPWEMDWPGVQRQGTPEQMRQAAQFTIRTPTTPESVTAELETWGPMERFIGGVGASAAETYYGAKDLAQRAIDPVQRAMTGEFGQPREQGPGLSPEDQRRLEEWQAIRGGAATAGRVAGDIAQTAIPAAKAYQLGRRASVGARALSPRRMAPIGAESAVVGGYEGLRVPEEGETRAGQAGTAAGLNLGLGAAMRTASRAVLPRGFPKSEAALREEQMLRELGIQPRLPLSLAADPRGPLSHTIRWLHREPFRATPGIGRALNRQIEDAMSDWQDAMILRSVPERARGEIPIPSQLQPTQTRAPAQQSIDAVNRWYGNEYAEILNPYNFPVRSGKTLTPRLQQALVDLPTGAKKKVTKSVNDLLNRYRGPAGTIEGSNVSMVKKELWDLRTAAKKKPALYRGYGGVIEALDDIVESHLRRQNLPLATRYAELREPYRNLATLEESVATRGAMGQVRPREMYAGTLRKAKREAGAKKVARGQAPLQEEARRAAEDVYTLQPRQNQGNIFQLNALLGTGMAGGLGAGAMAAPVYGGPLAAYTFGSLSPTIQRYLMQGTRAQQPLRRLQRSPRAQQLMSVGRVGTTAGLME